MADVFTKRKRSAIMSAVRSRGTKPEKALTAALRRLGFKPERNPKDLPGSPDAVLRRRRVAFFVNGCFWHGHRGCRRSSLPTTNRAFWRRKVALNVRRDARATSSLRMRGWHVFTFWTCRRIDGGGIRSRLARVFAR